MGLISTRRYDQAMRFFGDMARKIRTSPPIRVVRKLHSQSFQDVQQVQSEIERYYHIQYRPARSQSTSQPSRQNRPALPSGRPQSLPPANRPLGQLPPYRPNTSGSSTSRLSQPPAPRSQQPSSQQPGSQQLTSRSQQPPRYPQRPEQNTRWEQR
ncbi:MAG: hypothetical protein AAF268_07225 [Cyanobacteria bacterium P01_A01_bin.3]